MSLRIQIYKVRKQIKDIDLLKIKKLIDDEVERRTSAENQGVNR